VETLASIFLFLHIGGAIAAFGPTIAFGLIGPMAGKEPMHGNFALRIIAHVTERVVEPGAVFVFLMGIGLIWSKGWNPFTTLWLALAIILFLITLSVSVFVQLPTVKKMIAMTSAPPPASAEGQGPPGPPPGFMELQRRSAMGGQFLALMLFTILFLMVFKPTL
jgi:hypothetical protein